MTQLVVVDPAAQTTGPIEEVDLLTGFSETDSISAALPAFPLPKIDITASYIDFTSNEDGDFDIGPTASILFNVSNPALIDGDCELRFPRSQITSANASVDKSAITGVRFRVNATVTCAFRCLALRLVSTDWEYAPIDVDTRNARIERAPPPDGSLGHGSNFPTNVFSEFPHDWPVLFWSDDPAGKADPRPVDAKLSASFHTGSLITASGTTEYAAKFNQPGCVLISDAVDLRFTTALTVEAWIHPDSLTGTQAIVSKFQDTAGNRGYRLGLLSTGELQLQFSTDGTAITTVTSSGAAILAGQWTHIAVTYGSSTIKFYKNGALVSSTGSLPATIATNTKPFKIGAWNTG